MPGAAAEIIELDDAGGGFGGRLIEDGDAGGERFSALDFFLHGGDVATGVVGFVKGNAGHEGD